jgi:hypothetical protein
MLNTHRFLLPAILAFPRLPASRVGRRDRLCSPLHFLFFKKDRGRERGIRSAEIIKKVTLIPPYLQRSAVSASIPYSLFQNEYLLNPPDVPLFGKRNQKPPDVGAKSIRFLFDTRNE